MTVSNRVLTISDFEWVRSSCLPDFRLARSLGVNVASIRGIKAGDMRPLARFYAKRTKEAAKPKLSRGQFRMCRKSPLKSQRLAEELGVPVKLVNDARKGYPKVW